jgi:ferredoxin
MTATTPMIAYRIDEQRCVRCGACSSLAPTVFAIDAAGSRVAHQPETEAERRLAEAALLNCPTAAIKRAGGRSGSDVGADDGV